MEQPQLASALEAAWTALLPILPIWIFGAFVGFLVSFAGSVVCASVPCLTAGNNLTFLRCLPQLPRPKWTSRSATLLLSTPAIGSGFKWFAVVYHLVLVVR
jgi:hypothetical protein